MPTVSQNADLDMLSTSKILNLPDPTSAQDAATKAYVDAHSGGTFTASRAIVSNSSGALAVSTTTSAQIAALAALTNGRIPFSSGGTLTDSANATLDSSGNLTVAGTQQAAYHATKGVFTGSRQDMHGFVDSGNTYRWAIGLDASNNLYFNDQVNNKDVLTLLVGATYTTVRLPSVGTLSFNGGVTTIGLSSQATLSNTLEVNRGKILANSGSLGNVLAFSYYVTGNVAATNYSRITGTFTGTRTATLPDADITVAGSASALTSGRVSYATTGGLLIDSAGYLFDGTSVITLGVSGTSVGGVKLNNATSGSVTLQPVTGALGTVTASFPAASIVVAGSASALTSGRVPYATTGGLLTDSSSLTFDGTYFSVPSIILNNNLYLYWKDSGGTARRIQAISSANDIYFGAVDGSWGGAGALYLLSLGYVDVQVNKTSGSASRALFINANTHTNIGSSTSDLAQLAVLPSSSSTIGQIIKLAASQNADGWQLQDSSASILTRFNSAGNLGLGASPTYTLDVQRTTGTVAIRAASSTAGDILYYATGTVTGSLSVFNTAASATGTLTFNVANGNSASSTADAQHRMATQGGTSGDPYCNYSIIGVQDWVVGVDNSDSDRLKIGASSTPSGSIYNLVLNTTGEVIFAGGGNNYDVGLTRNAAGTLEVNNGTAGGFGALLAGRMVANKTSNYTVLSADKGCFFTNSGAPGEVDFTLPTAVAGLHYTFYVMTAQVLKVIAGASTSIRIAGSNSAAAGNITNSTIGGSVTLVAVSSTQWVAKDTQGTWTVT